MSEKGNTILAFESIEDDHHELLKLLVTIIKTGTK